MKREEAGKLVADFGRRFREEVALEDRLPFRIALMVEHLRRAETEMRPAQRRQYNDDTDGRSSGE